MLLGSDNGKSRDTRGKDSEVLLKGRGCRRKSDLIIIDAHGSANCRENLSGIGARGGAGTRQEIPGSI